MTMAPYREGTLPTLLKYDTPLLATVEILGHVRHTPAIVLPVQVAGFALMAVVFMHNDWSDVEGEWSNRLDTKYYGSAALFRLYPLTVDSVIAETPTSAMAFGLIDKDGNRLFKEGETPACLTTKWRDQGGPRLRGVTQGERVGGPPHPWYYWPDQGEPQ